MKRPAALALLAAALAIGSILLWRSSRAVEFVPRMVVAPKDAKVFTGNSLQFRTSLVGEAQQYTIRWSVVGPGSIDANGLYRAADVPATADVVATAGNGVADSASVQTVTAPKGGEPLILSTCYEDGTINVDDARDFSLVGGLSVGGRAAGVTVDPRSRRALVAAESQMIVIDLASMRWRASTPLPGARLSEVARLAFGYVAATDNNAAAGHPGVRLYRINASGVPVLESSVPAGETPEGIASGDSGRTFYVSNINSNSIMHFSIDSSGRTKLLAAAKTAARPFGLAIDPLRHMLFVTNNDTSVVSGPRAHPGLERFSLPSLRRIDGMVSTGSAASLPLGVAVDSAAAKLFVTNEGQQSVAVFSLLPFHRIAALPVGLTPWLPALDASQHRLYVPNARADSITVYDTRSLRMLKRAIPTCAYPTSVAIFNPTAGARRSAASGPKGPLLHSGGG